MQRPELNLRALAAAETGALDVERKSAAAPACWVEEYAATGPIKDPTPPAPQD
jgi:hypothetical protein